MLNVIVCGAAGRMGTSIINLSNNDKNVKIIGGVENTEIYMDKISNISIYSDISDLISSANVTIDFSSTHATLNNLDISVKNKKPYVIGTTGFNPKEIERIKTASRSIPIVFAPNMSIGVNVLFKLVSEASKTLANYDKEIVELHHNQKKDAPSGTAIKLAEIISDSMKKKLKDIAVYGRSGSIGPRDKAEMGVFAVRAGDIVGEHTVYFAGPGERVELTHRAHSRDTLASGALTAAKWIVNQKAGLYDMQDILGLKK
ncbi:4-hydroxy-tetrahydrodipicolinate reductase [Elusimicrobiota bacterium]